MIVVDELSSFKNHQSKRFKALRQVRPRIKRVVGLTGTPASNGLMDLWAEFKVIDMGKRLGRFITYYRQEYFVPDAMNGQPNRKNVHSPLLPSDNAPYVQERHHRQNE